ncbi:MAG TPA: hypothetical protein VJL10_11525 [Anaerolineales bacterium]|nr:hypothetical protein [Anaerolineales bacterium]
MTQILFVCTANRYRSPIAAACFKNELLQRNEGMDWSILSAGTWTTDGLPAMPEAIQRAKQIGLDLMEHRSRAITGEMLEHADLVLVMESGQKEALQIEFPFCREKILLLSEAAEGIPYNIPDPVENPSNVEVALETCKLVRAGFDKIYTLALK